MLWDGRDSPQTYCRKSDINQIHIWLTACSQYLVCKWIATNATRASYSSIVHFFCAAAAEQKMLIQARRNIWGRLGFVPNKFLSKVHIFWDGHKIFRNLHLTFVCTEGSRLMRISFLQISLLRFFKTFHEYLAYAILCTLCYCDVWLMRFYVLFISLLRSICLMQFLDNATFFQSQKSHEAKTLCMYCRQK